MSYVLLFVLLMVIAVLIKLSAMYLMRGSYSGGDDSDDSADDSSDNPIELDLIDYDEMPGHTGGADAPLSQDQLRNMFDLYPSAKK